MTEMDTKEKAMKAARKAIEKLVEDGTITEKALTENARSKIVEPYTRLLKALGFEFVWPAGYISPRMKQCPKCGSRKVQLQPSLYEERNWLCKCGSCFARSIDGTGPMDAIRKWNEKMMTEATEVVSKKIDPESVDMAGILSMVESAVRLAMQEYMENTRFRGRENALGREIECFVAEYMSHTKEGARAAVEQMRAKADGLAAEKV